MLRGCRMAGGGPDPDLTPPENKKAPHGCRRERPADLVAKVSCIQTQRTGQLIKEASREPVP